MEFDQALIEYIERYDQYYGDEESSQCGKYMFALSDTNKDIAVCLIMGKSIIDDLYNCNEYYDGKCVNIRCRSLELIDIVNIEDVYERKNEICIGKDNYRRNDFIEKDFLASKYVEIMFYCSADITIGWNLWSVNNSYTYAIIGSSFIHLVLYGHIIVPENKILICSHWRDGTVHTSYDINKAEFNGYIRQYGRDGKLCNIIETQNGEFNGRIFINDIENVIMGEICDSKFTGIWNHKQGVFWQIIRDGVLVDRIVRKC